MSSVVLCFRVYYFDGRIVDALADGSDVAYGIKCGVAKKKKRD